MSLLTNNLIGKREPSEVSDTIHLYIKTMWGGTFVKTLAQVAWVPTQVKFCFSCSFRTAIALLRKLNKPFSHERQNIFEENQ